MITYIKGDLMNAQEKMIAHGCNAQRKMGKGVAKLIRERFPYAYESYMARKSELGEVVFAYSNNNHDPIIANAITQNQYRKTYKDDGVVYADYSAIRSAFTIINDECVSLGINTVAIPKIGAGLAGGDWETIAEIIGESTPDIDVLVYFMEN